MNTIQDTSNFIETDLLITACDAGSANYLSPILNSISVDKYIIASGPAKKIFSASNIKFQAAPEINRSNLFQIGLDLLENVTCKAILCGTSWGPTIDKAMLIGSNINKIPSAAIIEHWSLYKERFSLMTPEKNLLFTKELLPKQIWVNDIIAMNEASKAGLNENLLKITGQPFLENQYLKLSQLPQPHKTNTIKGIVFISERIADDTIKGTKTDLGFTEFKVLKDLLIATHEKQTPIWIKLHPQENPNKYEKIINNNDRCKIISNENIYNLLVNSEKIVGMVSMLLLEAALVRNDVISYTPNADNNIFIGNKLKATNPANSIEGLKKLLSKNNNNLTTNGSHIFGKRFLGSQNRVISAISELINPCN